jgi:putative SOS response-associated peptidase YedK
MSNLYSITTNRAAIIALLRVMYRYVRNLPPMPAVFPDYPAPVVRNADIERELIMMRWCMPPPPKFGGQQHQTCKVRDGRRLLEHFSFGKK